MLTGENGIITKAIQAKEETEKAQYKELVEIIIMEKQIERKQNPNEETAFIEVVAEAIREKSWAKDVATCDDKEDYDVDPKYKNKIIVNTTDGYEIIVNIDNELIEGEVVSITKGQGKRWTITFHENGGSGALPGPIERREGWSLELPKGEKLSKAGYKLVGWSENPKEDPKGDKFYKPGEIYQPTHDTKLYAIWDDHTVELTFHSNTGESSSTNCINVGYNINTKLPANTFKNNGWNFREWNTNPEGTGTKYANGANIQITENTTLYAIWDEIVTATLSVINNKFTEGTRISLGGTAPSGIQKIELKVGNNVLHSNSNMSGTSYNLSNVGLNYF